jgi:hypothetical protein
MATINTSVNAARGNSFDRVNTSTFQMDTWDMEVYRELDQSIIMLSTCMQVSSDKITGKTYNQPKVGRMAVNSKVAGSPVNLQAYKEDNFQMEFRRYNESSFFIEDAATLFDDYNIRAEYTREVGYALAVDIDNWILGYRASIQRAGNFINSVDASGNNAPLSRAALLAAKLVMDKKFVPHTDRVWMFSPSQMVSLLADDKLTSADFVSGEPTMNGMIGRLYGYPVIVNNNILKNSVDGLSLITGIDGNGVRTYTTYPTPGYGFWNAALATPAATVSPYFPNKNLNGDSNSAGQQTELTITNSTAASALLPLGAYSGMLCSKNWLKFGWVQQPKTEVARETTYLADAVVTSQFYDAKVYRPESCVLVHSYEAA